MIILAKGATGENGPVVPCEPETVRFDHRGVRFAFDPNTLKLGVLKDGEKEEDVLRNFSLPFKPNFALGIPEVPGAICFDMTRACNLLILLK